MLQRVAVKKCCVANASRVLRVLSLQSGCKLPLRRTYTKYNMLGRHLQAPQQARCAQRAPFQRARMTACKAAANGTSQRKPLAVAVAPDCTSFAMEFQCFDLTCSTPRH